MSLVDAKEGKTQEGWLLQNPEHLVSAALAGAIGHLAKSVVKRVLGIITGAPLGFVATGWAWSMVN